MSGLVQQTGDTHRSGADGAQFVEPSYPSGVSSNEKQDQGGVSPHRLVPGLPLPNGRIDLLLPRVQEEVKKPIGRIEWSRLEGVLYGKIVDRHTGYSQYAEVTLRVSGSHYHEGDLPGFLQAMDARNPGAGWVLMASIPWQRYRELAEQGKLSAETGESMLKEHAEFLFLM